MPARVVVFATRAHGQGRPSEQLCPAAMAKVAIGRRDRKGVGRALVRPVKVALVVGAATVAVAPAGLEVTL